MPDQSICDDEPGRHAGNEEDDQGEENDEDAEDERDDEPRYSQKGTRKRHKRNRRTIHDNGLSVLALLLSQ